MEERITKFNRAAGVVLSLMTGVMYVYENTVYLDVLNRLPADTAAVAALQTENAFYYSYFQELVDTESFADGLSRIVWDRRTEYPDTLNAIRRFNIYQEILLALEFRFGRSLGLELPHPFHFFRMHIILLNGVGQTTLGLLAAEISGNPLASVGCYLASFLNRFQTSRLGNYTSSDLRELWGIPLLWLQSYLVWRALLASYKATMRRLLRVGLVLTTFAFIVSWQFSPFLLLLQATALYFVCIVLGFESVRPTLVEILNVYSLSLALAVCAHFGSPYLLTSPFFFQLVALKASTSICCCRTHAHRGWLSWTARRLAHVVEGLIAVLVFLLVRKALAPFATADTHVYEILCTKVSTINDMLPKRLQLSASQLPACAEPSFNANLYLIMGVFKILEWSSAEVYIKTTAAPAAAGAMVLIIIRFASHWLGMAGKAKIEDTPETARPSDTQKDVTVATKKKKEEPKAGRGRAGSKSEMPLESASPVQVEAEDAALLFFVVQFLLFMLLGSLVNRLRVAFGPPMMVLAAAVMGPRLVPVFLQRAFPKSLATLLSLAWLAHMCWMGSMLPCITAEEGICQHMADKFSNDGDLVDLYDWINNVVPAGTPVLASMNLAGSMRAFTHVPMIIHPQFESENLRKRVQRAYELYNCGSEESFAKTMEQLSAKLVIFEYSRCFFTPYNLDDKRKNCNSKKHKTEDLMCMKLHARSRFFKLMFMNGNYAVFRLRKNPLRTNPAPRASDVQSWLEEAETWKDYVQTCEKTQGQHCGPRLMEAAAHFHHGMKKPKVAAELRKWALKTFPENGYVNFYQARFLDVDANRPQEAKPFYDKALGLLPNNVKVLTEVILFYDLALQDSKFSASFVERRSRPGKAGEAPLLNLSGPGAGVLMCEAAVAAKNGGHAALSKQLWNRARELSPLSQCVKNNWPIIYGEKSQEDNSHKLEYTPWAKVKMVIAGGVGLEVGPHHQTNARFLGGETFVVWPPANKTNW
ncbi:putative C-mannosyltransferase DPY19L3 [Symbiodinium microadriaticum]|uniref:Putative C-mannosyltransferase DPY19L3 n=1 Tax=Symbiodinium microadriaticum TaxID=2951 RepID=A0A1Q9DPT3_SYMMI|nr:putative C-mannosyltransferase DPY19L3 [Symbiodinium microadriaticum]